MSGLLEFNAYQGEALLICLAASLVWAGMLLVGARGLERAAPMTSAEKLWTSALLFAVLPSLVAPTLAALGVSLRPMPEAVALEAAPQMTYVESSTAGAPAQPAQAPLVTTAQLIGGAALLYVYGAVLAFFLWAGRQACLQYAVARAQLIEDWDLYDRIEDWAERLEVRMPTIRRSRHVSSVCITGVARQTILVPEGIETRIGSDDLVLMCAHELAHVRRGDTRLFTATQLARVLFWFNPLVGRIARNAELAAEESADALVLDKGVDRRAYAACFVEGLKFAASKMNMQPALAPSFTPADPGGRRRRLNAILSPQAPKKTPLATRLLLSAAASTVALAAFGQAALAVDPESAGTQNSLLQNLPLVGEISQEFGDRRETAGVDDASAHSGVDIKAPMGAKIFAPGDGVVVEATSRYKGSTDWGKVVVIDHGHGFVTRFAHLDAYRVKKGDRVKAGEMIATVGVTGKTTGPHLHFETLRDGEPVDPANVIAAAPVAEPAAEPHPAAEPKPAAAQKPAGVARPSRTLRYSYKFAPAGEIPGAPGVDRFSPPNEFAAFGLDAPEFAGLAVAPPKDVKVAEASSWGFAGPSTFAALAEDLEERLLGAANGEYEGSYKINFNDGANEFRYSSDEPMTAQKRAELRKALKAMRKYEEKAQKEQAKIREKEHKAWREEMARMHDDAEKSRIDFEKAEKFRLTDAQIAAIRSEAEQAARNAQSRAYASREQAAEQRREAEEYHREAEERRREAALQREDANERRLESLEAQLEALEEARDSLEEQVDGSFEDALVDLEVAEADLEFEDLSKEEMDAARSAIRDQRRRLERDSAYHKRAIETAQTRLDSQIANVEKQIEALDEADFDE